MDIPTNMTQEQQLNLQSMLANNTDYVDNTELIRELKHSIPIASELSKMEKLKRTHAQLRETDRPKFEEMMQQECNFLYTRYTDIFIRVMRDELNFALMARFLHILQKIENGLIDQNQASVIVGTILKEMYVDSAVRRGEHLDEETPKTVFNEGIQISWKDYKNYIM